MENLMIARFFLLSLAVALVTLSGCGPARLDETKAYSLEMGETRAISPPAQSKPQTITVDYEAAPADVSVGAFKAADVKDLNFPQFNKAIKADSGKKGSFAAEVPENTEYHIIVEAKGKTDVKLHIRNR
jgi:hypothetical protein